MKRKRISKQGQASRERFERLKNPVFKNNQTRKYLKKLLHETIMTVDYSEPWTKANSQFVAELNFTILDWQIIERLMASDDSFKLRDIDGER